MLRPDLLPEATDCLQSQVRLYSSDGQWQLTAALERTVRGAFGRATNGCYRAGQRRSWVQGIEHGAWSQLRFRLKKHKYVFCLWRDDNGRKGELRVVGGGHCRTQEQSDWRY